jgi:hypothetical protein
MTLVKGLYIWDFFKLPKFQTHNSKVMVKYKKSQYRSYPEKAFNTLKYSPSKCLFLHFQIMPPKRPIVRFSVAQKKDLSTLYYDPCKGPLHLGLF